MDLNTEDKGFLLKVARDIIFAQITENEIPAYYKNKSIYEEKTGAFIKVTLKDSVRAYGGILEPETNLLNTIQNAAVQACFRDPRFSPITNEDFENINIHLAIIESVEDITDRKLILPQVHGLFIKFKGKSGVILPWDMREIPVDSESYIKEAALKAGITDYNNAQIKVIKTIIFDENNYLKSPKIDEE